MSPPYPTTEEKISGKMAAMKVAVRGRCPCRHRRTNGCRRRHESCAESAQAVTVNPIGSLIGSVGIFSFCASGTPLAGQIEIRCGQMTNENHLEYEQSRF
jgi:hypothetical protein